MKKYHPAHSVVGLIQKTRQIATAYFLMACHGLGLYDDTDAKIIEQRHNACQGCVLREGSFCSKKKAVSRRDFDATAFGAHTIKIIRGCGCWLPAKYHDRTPNPCPLNQWEDFVEYGDTIAI